MNEIDLARALFALDGLKALWGTQGATVGFMRLVDALIAQCRRELAAKLVVTP